MSSYRPTALARDILARAARPIPRYGTPDWHALPENDLRRVASILIGAECWRWHCSDEQVTEDLRDQLVLDDELVRDRLDQAAYDIRAAVPTISPEPWGYRVAAATAVARELARQRWADSTGRHE